MPNASCCRGAGLSGRGLRRAARGAMQLMAGTMQARRHLAALMPSAVVGFGGYASFPPLAAARLMGAGRRPAIVLHEQNAVLGRANRLMARAADLLALSFEGTANVPAGARAAVVGNPVRPALAALAGQPYPTPPEGGALRLLVTGGSQGARIFADVVPAAVAAAARGDPRAAAGDAAMPRRGSGAHRDRLSRGRRRRRARALLPRHRRPAGHRAPGDRARRRLDRRRARLRRAGPRCWCRCPRRSTITRPPMPARWPKPMRPGSIRSRPSPPAALAERLTALFSVPERLAAAAAAAARRWPGPQAARDLADQVLALARRATMGVA